MNKYIHRDHVDRGYDWGFTKDLSLSKDITPTRDALNDIVKQLKYEYCFPIKEDLKFGKGFIEVTFEKRCTKIQQQWILEVLDWCVPITTIVRGVVEE